MIHKINSQHIVSYDSEIRSNFKQNICIRSVVSFAERIKSFILSCFKYIKDTFSNLFISKKTISSSKARSPGVYRIVRKEDQTKIFELIHTMGLSANNWSKYPSLALKQSKLKQLSRDIKNVHVLKFLEFIFLSPTLVKDIKEIMKDSWIRKNFMTPLCRNLNFALQVEGRDKHLTKFTKALKIDKKALIPYFDEKDWYGLVNYLCKIKR